jgi:hypothetical protein
MGLTPDQVYNMELWEFNAYSKGYATRRKNDYADCIYTGYYSGVFSPFTKRRPTVAQLLKRLFGKESHLKPEVDVKEFKRREQAFNERLKKQNADKRQ